MKDADGFITKEQFLAAVDGMKQEGSGGDQAGTYSAATTKDKWGRMPGEAAADIGAYQLKDHLEMTFPMYAISISTLMAMEKMRNFEELRNTGELEEWNKSKGPVFFLSHQWTSFDEPDHTGTQLRTAQEIFRSMQAGTIDKNFGSPEDWRIYAEKDSSGTGIFPYVKVTAEGLQKEASEGFIWLDYACIPQAADAQEDRLKAIESIPHYIDASTSFIALCPYVAHKELAGTHCDYHTWRMRGWCRLEEQVNELKLFTYDKSQEWAFAPGTPHWDVPRRSMIVHTANHITTGLYECCKEEEGGGGQWAV